MTEPCWNRFLQFPDLHIYKVRNRLQQEIALRDHIRVKGNHIRRACQCQRVIEVSCLGAFIIGAVKISDAHFFRKFSHLRPPVIVTDPDMHLGSVRIFHMDTAIDGPLQKLSRLIVSGNKDIHIRPCAFRDLRQRMLTEAKQVTVQDDRFYMR